MSIADIALPSINGDLEAGITAGVDPRLPDHQKLPVFMVGKELHPDAVKNAAMFATTLPFAKDHSFFYVWVYSP